MPAGVRRARSKSRSSSTSAVPSKPKARAPRKAAAAPAAATCRDRLGLALAGGGFRAALFHVGVFRRLAELDLLRHVEVLSTVSGGSIVGALYVLLLKRELEREKGKIDLTPADYTRIVDDLETRLVAGINRNLRAMLFADPVDLIGVMLRPQRTLGDRMAKLYENHIYASTVRELGRKHSGDLLLQELRIRPGQEDITHWKPNCDIDSYNRERVRRGGSAITKLVINATSLNTGARFLFKATELGEWQYGYARLDEAEALASRKCEIDAVLREPLSIRNSPAKGVPPATLARWVVTGEPTHLTADGKKLIEKWPAKFNIASGAGRGAGLEAVRTAELGLLRLARVAAWHLRKLLTTPGLPDSGGFTTEEYHRDLVVNLGLITHDYAERIEAGFMADESLILPLCNFIDEVYLYRSARNIAATIAADWGAWRLSEAVAASANFPPVFPPLTVYRTFDDLVVSRLGLTDGGVYDNLGVVGLINEGCNYVISSDTGLVARPVQHVSQGHVGMLGRIATITSDNTARHMRSLLVDRHQVSAGLESAYRNADQACPPLARDIELVHSTRRMQGYVGMRIDPPAVLELEARERTRRNADVRASFGASMVAYLRTDLDRFGDIEANALINQGYVNAGLYVRQWLDYASGRTPDDRPPHARARYDAAGCGNYQYARARDSSYRDARDRPLRPIANVDAGGHPDPRDTRVGRVLRAGRRLLFRGFQCGRPWSLRQFLPWLALAAIAAAALMRGWAALADSGLSQRIVRLQVDITVADVIAAVVAVGLFLVVSRLLRVMIVRGIRRAEDAGKLDRARRLAAVRRWPAKLLFWLVLAALVAIGAAFWPGAVERALTEQLLSATRGLAIELALIVVGALLLAAIGWLMWLDGWLAAAMQRLNRTGRPGSAMAQARTSHGGA